MGSTSHFSLPKTIYDTNQLRKWCHMVPTHGTSVKVCDGSPNFCGWWCTYPSDLHESQLGWLFPIYGKIKNVPNHQPVLERFMASIAGYILWSTNCLRFKAAICGWFIYWKRWFFIGTPLLWLKLCWTSSTKLSSVIYRLRCIPVFEILKYTSIYGKALDG